jgi:hypothetical protein
MEQQKAMECGSRKASSDVVNPRNIYNNNNNNNNKIKSVLTITPLLTGVSFENGAV